MPPNRNEQDKGLSGWIRGWWRPLAAELISTALVVRLACGTDVPVPTAGAVQLSRGAFTAGFVVLANIYSFGPVSGAHMNPAFTLAALLHGQLAPLPALGYVLAQLAGATLGYGALLASVAPDVTPPDLCVTVPAEHVSLLGAVSTEMAITSVIVFALCSVWSSHDPNHPDHTVPIKIGLIVVGLIYAAGPTTCASFNPARSFGPALLSGHWTHHWVYWVGPLLGSALAAVLHKWVMTAAPPRAVSKAELADAAEAPLGPTATP